MAEPKDKTQTIGWMISEIYPMVRKIYRHLGVDGEPAKPVNEQVAYLEGQLQTCREQRGLDKTRVEFLDAQVEALRQQLAATVPISNEPYLGLATNEMLFRELISRLGSWEAASAYYTNIDRVVKLAEMLGSMSASEREYRTVDGD